MVNIISDGDLSSCCRSAVLLGVLGVDETHGCFPECGVG